MSLLSLPNELLLNIIEGLDKDAIYSIVRTNRRLSILLTPRLLEIACSDYYCVTALYLAAANGSEEMIRLLLDKGSMMSIRYSETPDEKPLIIPGLSQDEKEAVVKHLLEKRAESIIQDRTGLTAIHLAARSRNISMAKILLGKGASTSIDCANGMRPINIAVSNRDEAMVRLLIESGDDVNIPLGPPGSVYKNPVIAAILADAKDIVKLLVENGADVNEPRNWTGATILNWMVSHSRYREMIKLLLDLGADPNIPDDCGDTALDTCSDRQESMYMLLKSYGALTSLELSNGCS